MKKLLFRGIVLAVLAGGAYAGYKVLQSLPGKEQTIPTTTVRQGDVVVRSFTRGELRATRSVTLTAPNLFGQVQVTRLAPLGAFAKEKDLVVEFDDSEVKSRLEEKELELEQIDEQIKKSEADLATRSNQDQVELLSARFAVRRAELEVQRNPLLAAIDAKKNVLNLEESRRRLKQLESDIQSRHEQALAEIAVLQERKNKGNVELSREKARLQQVKLLAPMSGLVAVKQNRTGFMFAGAQIPDIREGDQVQPGIPVADILDISEMEVLARVGELDRANLRDGQEVLMRLDATADKTLHGRIKSMSGTASSNPMSFDPAKRFDVVFSVDMRELLQSLGAKPDQIQRIEAAAVQNQRHPSAIAMPSPPAGPPGTPPLPNLPAMFSLPKFTDKELESAKLPPPPEEDNHLDVLLRPGLLADVEIIIEKIPNAIHVPMQAVFDKDGKMVVYVKKGDAFEPRTIKPMKRSESIMVMADGVAPGEVIALADPTVKKGDKRRDKAGSGAGPMGALPGGGK